MTKAMRMADQIEAGTVYINNFFNAAIQSLVVGFKQSGYGRENGWEGCAACSGRCGRGPAPSQLACGPPLLPASAPSGTLSSTTGLRARRTEIARARTAMPSTGSDPEIVDTIANRLHLEPKSLCDRRGSTANTAGIHRAASRVGTRPTATSPQRVSKHVHIKISRRTRSARGCSGAKRWRCSQRGRASPRRIERNRENQARGWRDHRGRGHEAVS